VASTPANGETVLTTSDVRRAAAEGVIASHAAEALLEWVGQRRISPEATLPPSIERRQGLNLVSVLYYLGAMLMISACAWFLGDKWDALGSRGILITTLVYATVSATLGAWLRRKGFLNAGGLLVTVSVSLVPLLTYCVEDLLGLWPTVPPGPYKDFYPWIHGSWMVMELATVAAGAVALRFVHFGFLTAPLAFALWFFSMDLAAYLGGESWESWDRRRLISIVVGLTMMLVGFGAERIPRRRSPSEDYAFWTYLFGLLAFSGALTLFRWDSESAWGFYALINLGLVGVAIPLRRVMFLVFGALGLFAYASYLAWIIFAGSQLFPFVVALIGLSLILGTVSAQRYLRRLPAR
jgi:hypothetical protein